MTGSGRVALGLQIFEDLLGAVDDRPGQPGELGDVDAVGFVGRAPGTILCKKTTVSPCSATATL